jgi:hypothetical protein
MKDDKPFEKDEKLSKLLHTWKLDAQLPPRFKERVWQRIERGESTAKIAFWKVIAARIEATFVQRGFAAAYVAVLLLAGMGAGYWKASDRTARVESEWRTRYVQTVDPYQIPR